MPPAKNLKNKGLTSANRAFRDLIALEMLADGTSYPEVSAVDGRSESTLRLLRKKYAASGSGVPDLLNEDPVRIIENMLRRKQVAWRLFAQVAMASEGTARIAAIKGMLQADERTVELLQHVGKLPRELGTLRHVIDVREIAEKMLTALDQMDAGEISPGEVRVAFEELAGIGAPAVDAVVVEEEEESDGQ